MCLLATVVALGLAVSVSPKFYWLAALTSWTLSFLGAWSIGPLTLVATWACVALAIGHAAGWIRRPAHSAAAVAAGVGIWFLLVTWVDDRWLFFPLNMILEWVLG